MSKRVKIIIGPPKYLLLLVTLTLTITVLSLSLSLSTFFRIFVFFMREIDSYFGECFAHRPSYMGYETMRA